MRSQVVFGGGCFWCTEAMFAELKGVDRVESGFAGGSVPNPTYRQVCGGDTGHAEAVRITFDPTVISRRDLLLLHMTTHDPTTLNRQGGDVGTQYRSVIFFSGEAERAEAQAVIDEVAGEAIYEGPIVTTLEPLTQFYPAEDYHQEYFSRYELGGTADRAMMNSGYCQAVIAPKVAKFRQKHAARLKD